MIQRDFDANGETVFTDYEVEANSFTYESPGAHTTFIEFHDTNGCVVEVVDANAVHRITQDG